MSGVIVIAGGSKGLGLTTAIESYKMGSPVALIARSDSELKEAHEKIKGAHKSSAKISCHVADLTDASQCTEAFKQIIEVHENIRALINSMATWTGGKRLLDLSREDIQRSLDLNFFTAFNASKSLLELRKKKLLKGDLSIVNIGATSSLQGWQDVSAFSLGKGALRIFSQSLARELGPEGVHVAHLVIDGLIDNERTRQLNPNTPEEKFMKMEPIAKSILHVAFQEKSCWTFELDVRPYNENW